tara:strand:- start:235 stop:492 length:258 start_codon:yes stop_codon:yes gene_type:complete
MSSICECNPNSDGNPTADYLSTCQGKVNSGKMTLKEDKDLCKCKKKYISIPRNEKERLERIWKGLEIKFEWVWNKEESCYYPVFH